MRESTHAIIVLCSESVSKHKCHHMQLHSRKNNWLVAVLTSLCVVMCNVCFTTFKWGGVFLCLCGWLQCVKM